MEKEVIMAQNPSVLQLERCILTSLHIEPNIESQPESPQDAVVDIAVTSDIRQHQTDQKYMVTAIFTATWAGHSFFIDRIEVGLRGIFSFPVDTPEDVIASYVPVLCVANLYGTARGIVAQATGICPGGVYWLPLLDMNAMLQQENDDVTPKQKPKARSRKRVTKAVNEE